MLNITLREPFLFVGKKRRLQNPRHPAAEPGVPYEHMPLQNDECEFCFQSPCVTLRDLHFVGNGQVACDNNSAIRKEKYRKYWKVMTNIGGWNDPRYLAVKQERANGGEWAIQHRREVIPKCVLQQLRNLYPNPKDKSYMDHKWE